MTQDQAMLFVRIGIFAFLCVVLSGACYFAAKSNLGIPACGVIIFSSIFVNGLAISVMHGMHYVSFSEDFNRLRDHVMLVRYIEIGPQYDGDRFNDSYSFADEFMSKRNGSNLGLSVKEWVYTIIGSSFLLFCAGTYGVSKALNKSIFAIWS
ncbi:MAG: hypothetical protein IOB85_12100 [Methylobacterium sp.]|nr:hypothetical protein [Methylobacterium sp.]MCA3655412.1 hypothetical protein [Methylobacterium sp.]MCA3658705.1 hypothetical protein [Methylobacterium sp.]MCA3661330.1 hypothetical protein [Methylobacterium sp.]MCA3663697.1 hypothetical protein [Methylobacterium sp.]